MEKNKRGKGERHDKLSLYDFTFFASIAAPVQRIVGYILCEWDRVFFYFFFFWGGYINRFSRYTPYKGGICLLPDVSYIMSSVQFRIAAFRNAPSRYYRCLSLLYCTSSANCLVSLFLYKEINIYINIYTLRIRHTDTEPNTCRYNATVTNHIVRVKNT